MNLYDLFRGLHILAIIAWMAGLLYLPRLFIYHIKHSDQPVVTDVFKVMERKLLRLIMNPAMVAAWIFGVALIWVNVTQRTGWAIFHQPWFIVKLLGVVAITGWHHVLAARFKKLQRNEPIGSEKFWRMANEIPFILAIIMVMAVTLEFFNR